MRRSSFIAGTWRSPSAAGESEEPLAGLGGLPAFRIGGHDAAGCSELSLEKRKRGQVPDGEFVGHTVAVGISVDAEQFLRLSDVLVHASFVDLPQRNGGAILMERPDHEDPGSPRTPVASTVP